MDYPMIRYSPDTTKRDTLLYSILLKAIPLLSKNQQKESYAHASIQCTRILDGIRAIAWGDYAVPVQVQETIEELYTSMDASLVDSSLASLLLEVGSDETSLIQF